MLSMALQVSDSWLASGSLCSGDIFVPRFTLVTGLRVNYGIGIKRL